MEPREKSQKAVGFLRNISMEPLENHKAVGFLRNIGMEPLENHKAVGFLRNIGMEPLENHKAVGFLRNIGIEPLENHKAVGFLRNIGMEPLENHKAVGFLRNIGMEPLANHKAVGFLRKIGISQLYTASIQCWAIIGPPVIRHFNVFLLAANGGPLCLLGIGFLRNTGMKKMLSKLLTWTLHPHSIPSLNFLDLHMKAMCKRYHRPLAD